MPSLNVNNPGGVIAANANTTVAVGTSGTVISAGQVVWLDASGTVPVLKPASATVQGQAGSIVGVALDTVAGSMQIVNYATTGDIILPTTGTGTTLFAGSVYVLSHVGAGSIIPDNELTAGNYSSLIGVGLNAPNTLRLALSPVAAKK